MDYLVTGGAGYIGGHFVDTVAKKSDVAVIDDFSTGHYVCKYSRIIKADLRNMVPKIGNVRVLMHFAANPDVKGSMHDIKSHYERDVTATLNALELARKSDAETIVFASSSTVYGYAKKVPTPEESPFAPVSGYGLFKAMGENLVSYYSMSYGIRSISLRFANIIGGRTGHGIIYNYAKWIKEGKPLEVWGDGNQKKSYVYVHDLIDAIHISIKEAGKGYSVFNVGNKDQTRVNEIIEIFEDVAGKRFRIKRKDSQEGDVRNFLLDSTKLRKLGWKPKYNSSEAVRQAVIEILKDA